MLVLVLGGERRRVRSAGPVSSVPDSEDEDEHEGGSPLAWTAASTSPGRLGGRHREPVLSQAQIALYELRLRHF